MSDEERLRAVLDAYRSVFPNEWKGAPGEAVTLTETELRDAFRARAFAVHPDRSALLGRSTDELAAELRTVVAAHRLLRDYLREVPVTLPVRKNPIAAPRRLARPNGERLYLGPLPRRKLMLGEYLYYASWISRSELTSAIEWQRASRPRFGEIAIELGVLSDGQVHALLRMRQRGTLPLGTFAVDRSVMSVDERDAVLREQRRRQRPIGSYFAECAILSRPMVRRLAVRHLEYNRTVNNNATTGQAGRFRGATSRPWSPLR